MSHHAVVTPHHLSAQAAREVMLKGGNAVDGAIAAVAAQGVVAPETCGVGGDLFALIHRPGWDRPRALNASGRAGSNADPDALRENGWTEIPADHPATVTIPGCIDGLAALATALGNLSLAQALDPAIRLAEDGFEASNELAASFAARASVYRNNPAVTNLYPGGEPVGQGDMLSRSTLAATLSAVAEEGREAFYLARPGEDIVAAVGGLITLADLAQNQADWVEPLSVEVAGLRAWTIPPNSQGYLGPATLAVFEMLEPPHDSDHPLWWHLLIEAYRSLAWERNDLVADPAHAPLPAHLILDRERLERAASTVDRERAGSWPGRIGKTSGTAYLCVCDAEGLAVSIIQSNYRGPGSPFGAARSGFLLQDRGGGFSLTPGHPNELNPGKRPLHTLSPTLWTQGDKPRILLGTRGGAVQPQLVAQVAARVLLAGETLEVAQQAPRWTVADFGPGSVPQIAVEPGVPEGVLLGLSDRGHRVETMQAPQSGWGPVSIIELDGEGRRAAADPRVDTTAADLFRPAPNPLLG